MTIGENIRYLRKQAHFSQKQLAELTGVNEVTIRSYESGKYKPKMENLSKLCTALNCNITDITGASSLPVATAPDDTKQFDTARYKKIIDKIKRQKPLDSADIYFLCNDCMQEYYQQLNSDGKKQANKLLSDFMDNLSLLTKIPEYQENENSK